MSFPIAPPPLPHSQPFTSTPASSSTGQSISDPIPIDSDSQTDTTMPSTSSRSGSGAKSLQKLAERRVLDDLKAAVQGHQAAANYFLGGTIPISPSLESREHNYSSSKKPIIAPPVVVRFDTPYGMEGMGKVQFPVPRTRERKAV
jgi:hypothetical protein